MTSLTLPTPTPDTPAWPDALLPLRAMVAQRAGAEGRTDSVYPGLRYYRFSGPTGFRKKQRLIPGLVVVVQGRKTVVMTERSLSYDAQHCLVLAGEALCHGTVVEASADTPYLAIHLDLPPDMLVRTLVALAEGVAATPLPAPVHHGRDAFVAPVDGKVLEALARLLPATDDEADRRLIAPLVVEEIVVRLLQSAAAGAVRSAAAVSRNAARIQLALRFMREHLAEPLTVDRLAGEVAMSPSHFAHCFREVVGISPMRYLRDARLEQARQLMLGHGLRASDASARSGFASVAHFTREFKARFDTTPADYVRRLRGA